VWSVWPEPVDVYLGTRGVAVCRGSDVLHVAQPGSAEACRAELRRWAAHGRPPGLRWRVWLSGGLCQPWLVSVAQGVSSVAERALVARASLAGLGLAPDARLWIEPATLDQSAVAVALDPATANFADAWPRESGARLVSLRPWWAEALGHGLRRAARPDAVAVVDCDSVTWLAADGAGFSQAKAFTPLTEPAAIAQTIARQKLGMAAERPVVSTWTLRLDASAPRAGALHTGLPLVAFAEVAE